MVRTGPAPVPPRMAFVLWKSLPSCPPTPNLTSASGMHFAELLRGGWSPQGVSLGVLISLVTAAWPAPPPPPVELLSA